jgi:hypothetical protein
MKLGAEPKKVAWLAGLIVTAGMVYYFESDTSSPVSSPAPSPGAAIVPVQTIRPKTAKRERRRETNASAVKDWKPRLGFPNPEDRPDPATVDPRLRLELLAKVQGVQPVSQGRNVFMFGAAPVQVVKALPKVEPIAISRPQPPPPPPGPTQPPPPPPPPPIALKYYGYKVSKSDGHKAAFLLDGDDILIGGENDTVKRRYRIVKIGISSITIEDTQSKSTQTLQLQENMSG